MKTLFQLLKELERLPRIEQQTSQLLDQLHQISTEHEISQEETTHLSSEDHLTSCTNLDLEKIRLQCVSSFHSIYGPERENNFSKSLSPSGFEFFNTLISSLSDRSEIRYLEIGSFEGISMMVVATLLERHQKQFELTSIDPYPIEAYWENNPLLGKMQKIADKTIKESALELYTERNLQVNLIEDYSTPALCRLLSEKRSYDLIYVDGYHEETLPLQDIGFSLSLLDQQGILIIDDWIWPDVLPLKQIFDRHYEKIAEHPQIVAYRRK